jgi:predicted nucleotidyltransferase
MRGDQHRAAIRAVLEAFGDDARHFVFIGGCALGLYARSEGAPLRATKDVDCISTLSPWVLQDQVLGELCARGVLSPDVDLQCRYRIRGSEVVVDVLSPEGFNVGGASPWFARAAARAGTYSAGAGRNVAAITPPYFLATKLAAFEDRGPDAQSGKDAEDIVALHVEVADLVALVDAEGLRRDIHELWQRVCVKYGLRPADVPDLIDWHLDSRDREHRPRVVEALGAMLRGS